MSDGASPVRGNWLCGGIAHAVTGPLRDALDDAPGARSARHGFVAGRAPRRAITDDLPRD